MRRFQAPPHTSSVHTSIGNIYQVAEDGTIELSDDAHEADDLSLKSAGCVELDGVAPSPTEVQAPAEVADDADKAKSKT